MKETIAFIGVPLLTAVLIGVFWLLGERGDALLERGELRTELAACRDTCARYDMPIRLWPDSVDSEIVQHAHATLSAHAVFTPWPFVAGEDTAGIWFEEGATYIIPSGVSLGAVMFEGVSGSDRYFHTGESRYGNARRIVHVRSLDGSRRWAEMEWLLPINSRGTRGRRFWVGSRNVSDLR